MKGWILLPLALIATAAGGQTTAVPSHMGKPMFYDTPDTRQRGAVLLRHMGSCLYGKERAASVALLRSVPGSKDEENRMSALHSRFEECVNGDAEGIRFTNFVFRGALAEGIFLTKFPTDPVVASNAATAMGLPTSWMEAYRKDPSIAPTLALHQFAACVAGAAPIETSKLVRTNPSSAEESASFSVLGPHFGPCVTQGRTFSSDRTTLRALLAEALYDRFVGVEAAE